MPDLILFLIAILYFVFIVSIKVFSVCANLNIGQMVH